MSHYQTSTGHRRIFAAGDALSSMKPHPRVFRQVAGYAETDLERTERFEQFRNSEKPSLHFLVESQEFSSTVSSRISTAQSATTVQ
jgi:hypothetical protein